MKREPVASKKNRNKKRKRKEKRRAELAELYAEQVTERIIEAEIEVDDAGDDNPEGTACPECGAFMGFDELDCMTCGMYFGE